MNSPKKARNKEIVTRHKKGETMLHLANIYGLTKQRIHQIIKSALK